MALMPEMERIMSKTTVHNSEANLEARQLTDDELDAVSGGASACDLPGTLCIPVPVVGGVIVIPPSSGGGGLVHEPIHAS